MRKSFKSIPAFLTLVVLVVSNQSRSACSFDDADDSITFPSGKKIYFDFGAHVTAVDAGCMVAYDNPNLDLSEIKRKIEQCRQVNKLYLDTLAARRIKIQSIIAKDRNVSWGGLEFSPEETAMFYSKDTRERLRIAERKRARRGVAESELRELRELSDGNSSMTSWARAQRSGRGLNLIGLEKQELKDRGSQYISAMGASDSALRYDAQNGRLSKKVYASILERGAKILKDHETPSQRELDEMVESTPEISRSEARKFLQNAGNVVALSKPREAEVVQNALSQSGNGIITFGEAHKESLIRQFESACRQYESTSSSRPRDAARSAR